jgi:hypothetical protein
MPRPLYPRERAPVPIGYETVLALKPVWPLRGTEKPLTSARNRTPAVQPVACPYNQHSFDVLSVESLTHKQHGRLVQYKCVKSSNGIISTLRVFCNGHRQYEGVCEAPIRHTTTGNRCPCKMIDLTETSTHYRANDRHNHGDDNDDRQLFSSSNSN